MTEPLIKLKPCPFCGKNRIELTETGGFWYVFCFDCSTSGPEDLGNSGACEAWNTRPVEAQLLEACKAALEWAAQYPLGIASCEPDRDAARVVYHLCHAAIAAAEGEP